MTEAPLAWRGRLPITVIGGYLGAGKTTLVNNLLRVAGERRLCVLVNDFGAVPIDRDLIVAASGDAVELSGGCVCCSYGSDLVETLAALPARMPWVEHVLLEASGVALPGQVASSVALLPFLRVDGVVVLVDAETVRARADDTYVGDTIRRQVAAADLVIVNRCDLVGRDVHERTVQWLATAAPAARVVSACRAAVASELVLGLREGSVAMPIDGLRASAGPVAASVYESLEFDVPPLVDVAALARRLTMPGLGVLRAKAIVEDRGKLAALHVVGMRAEIDDAPASARPGRLVAIGLRGRLDGAGIERALQAPAC